MPEANAILTFVIWYVAFIFSTTVHEFGHAVTAYWGGDSTAYDAGQVSLDPMPHIRREPFGMAILPILSFVFSGFVIGYASAPYNPRWAERNPTKYAGMSAAGPAGNFILAGLAFGIMTFLLGNGTLVLGNGGLSTLVLAPGAQAQSTLGAVAMFLSVMLALNVILGTFNLLPIPPLDGSGVLEGLFPDKAGAFYQKLRSQPGLSIFGLIIAWNVYPFVATPVLSWVVGLLYS